MGEGAEGNIRNEYYDLMQTTCYKRTVYPENCASLLYKTLKAEECHLKRADGIVELPDKDQKNLTNKLTEIQTVSLMSNKVLKELSRDHLTWENLHKTCESAIKKHKEAQTVLRQIENEPNDNTSKYVNC